MDPILLILPTGTPKAVPHRLCSEGATPVALSTAKGGFTGHYNSVNHHVTPAAEARCHKKELHALFSCKRRLPRWFEAARKEVGRALAGPFNRGVPPTAANAKDAPVQGMGASSQMVDTMVEETGLEAQELP